MTPREEGCTVLALGDVDVRWESPDYQPDAEESRITDEAWAAATASNGAMFDSELLIMSAWQAASGHVEIKGRFVRYRRFAAQSRDSRLRRVSPVAVSALTVIGPAQNRSVLVGQRSSSVTQYPGFIELVPSGSIGRNAAGPDGLVDYRRALITELYEEAGIASDRVEAVRGRSLCFDHGAGVYDIGCEVVLREADKDPVRYEPRNAEYDWVALVPETQLVELVNERAGEMVPTSVALLSVLLGS